MILFHKYHNALQLEKKNLSVAIPKCWRGCGPIGPLKRRFWKEKIYNHLGKQSGTYHIPQQFYFWVSILQKHFHLYTKKTKNV